ncbi:hypothetical protein E2562_030509 [Oryza meyeriana var. granulata]|uniref:MADS-box domain-containing protein n=1 Tax=Oryza meyeriana var. granulata TaxID=110450 RepID=A0A6G1BPM3_9ORYZ|nr:hypothetical protein E2562_030509 [Oryza meyeriana var. granulata]
MVRPLGRPSMGLQRIEIRLIDTKGPRQVTFSKRRGGLFKKASELALLTGASVAVVGLRRAADETRAQVAAEQVRMRGVTEKIVQAKAGRRFWWEADVDALGEAEMPEFARALEKLRANVVVEVSALMVIA